MVSQNGVDAVRGVVFDFFGTLTPGTTAAARDAARIDVARALGVDGERFARAVRDTFDERARGRTGDMVETLRWLAARCDVEPTEGALARACERRLAVEREFMAPREEALDVLRQLRASGHKVGVLSDCTHELPLLWPALPYESFVDVAVFSCEMATRKPDPRMYAAVCERLGLASSACLYVGDGGSNELSGARVAGMRAIHLQAPEFADAHTFDPERDWAGPVIQSLRELLALSAC